MDHVNNTLGIKSACFCSEVHCQSEIKRKCKMKKYCLIVLTALIVFVSSRPADESTADINTNSSSVAVPPPVVNPPTVLDSNSTVLAPISTGSSPGSNSTVVSSNHGGGEAGCDNNNDFEFFGMEFRPLANPFLGWIPHIWIPFRDAIL